MQQIIHNPVDGIYAATPDYVHALVEIEAIAVA